MKTFTLRILGFVLLVPGLVFSQSAKFDSVYAGQFGEPMQALQTSDGGFAIAGYSQDNEAYFLMRTTPKGKVKWTKYYPGITGNQLLAFNGLTLTPNGDFILTGWTAATSTSTGYLRLLRTSGGGVVKFDKYFTSGNGAYGALGYDVAPTSDGGCIVSGESWSSFNKNALIMKFNYSGQLVWEKNLNTLGVATTVQQTPDGNYITTVYKSNSSTQKLKTFLYKLSSNGVVTWKADLFVVNGYYDFAYRMILTGVSPDGNYLVVRTNSAGFFPNSISLIKYDPSGNLLWEKAVSYCTFQQSYSFSNTVDSGFVVAGKFAQGSDKGYYFMRFDKNGDSVFTQKFDLDPDPAHAAIAFSGQQTADKDYMIAGMDRYTIGPLQFLYYAHLIKFNPFGFSGQEKNCEAHATPTSNAFLIFPNPLNAEATIQVSDWNDEPFNFEVFDLKGEKVSEINNIQSPSFIFRREDLKAGTYLFRIHGDRINSVGKLIVVD